MIKLLVMENHPSQNWKLNSKRKFNNIHHQNKDPCFWLSSFQGYKRSLGKHLTKNRQGWKGLKDSKQNKTLIISKKKLHQRKPKQRDMPCF